MPDLNLKNNPLAEDSLDLIEAPDIFKTSVKFFSPEVHDFFIKEGILEQARIAVDLVKQHFSLDKDPELKLDEDPETEEKHAVVEFTAQGEISEVLEQYHSFTTAWVSSGPWSLRRKICLEYGIKTPNEPS